MTTLFIAVLASTIVGFGCWLGWQLLRQNGRMLLRLDELEKRLDALEFGESDSQLDGAAPTDDRADRFSRRSLARSKINRDGLKPGALAPGFRLPRLDGSGDLGLEELRGRRVLLVFSDPRCGPCNALAPHLENLHRWSSEISVVMISRGEPKENRAKVKEHSLTFPIILQQQWEVSRLYAIFATPVAYLIDEAGVIKTDVAVGVDAIQALMARASAAGRRSEPAPDGPLHQIEAEGQSVFS